MPSKYTLEAAPVDFRALEFKPQELKVEGPDMNLHAQALARYEQRKKEAQQERKSFDTTLEKIRTTIGDDEDSKQWFDNFVAKHTADIDEAISTGDYGKALSLATLSGNAILRDEEYLDRKKNWEDYKLQRDAIEKNNNINQITKQRWLETHKYEYNVGADGRWHKKDDKFNPYAANAVVDDIDWERSVALAMGMAQPKVTSSNTQTSTGSQISNTNAEGITHASGSTSGSQYSTQRTLLPYEKLRENITTYFKTSEHRAQAAQAFENDVYVATKLKEQIDEAKRNNSPNLASLENEFKQYEYLFEQTKVKDLNDETLNDYIFRRTEAYARNASRDDISISAVTQSTNQRTDDWQTAGTRNGTGNGKGTQTGDEQGSEEYNNLGVKGNSDTFRAVANFALGAVETATNIISGSPSAAPKVTKVIKKSSNKNNKTN